MKRVLFLFIMAFMTHMSSAMAPLSYGYKVQSDDKCTVWWAEGAYKIMKSDKPASTSDRIVLSAARNEYEPFQVVISATQTMNNVHASVSNLVSEDKQSQIDKKQTEILNVDYIEVIVPTDHLTPTGVYPDALPPYKGAFTAHATENTPLWFNVFVPTDTKPGKYTATVTLVSGSWKCEIPVELNVRDFTLPKVSSMRSSFGLRPDFMQPYHRLETRDEMRVIYDKYMECFAKHRIAVTSPFDLYPVEVHIDGLEWENGIFTPDHKVDGNYSLMVEDTKVDDNVGAKSITPIKVTQGKDYNISWSVRTAIPNQEYTVAVACYDPDGREVYERRRIFIMRGDTTWKKEQFGFHALKGVDNVKIELYPTYVDQYGFRTGSAWFDNIAFEHGGGNLLACGNFEVDPLALKVNLDFTDFDIAGRRYLDELGFNVYNLTLPGLPSGSFYKQTYGVFAGFKQGSPEYKVLMKQYLGQVEQHLEQRGWLGKEYVYWFDEPAPHNYEFVREGMKILQDCAPKLKRFITEHEPGNEIMDITDISCTRFDMLNIPKIKEITAQGREYWSYLCTAPRAPWVSEFIDHDAVNMRMWLWMSYKYNLTGILMWSSNYWNSPEASPTGVLQDVYKDPMAWMTEYGTPRGAYNSWGNGDGRFVYPPKRDPNVDKSKSFDGPVTSIRLEILREGMEDYEYIKLLEKAIEKSAKDKKLKALVAQAKELLEFPQQMFVSSTEYNKDPLYLISYRNKIAEMIEKLN